MSSLIKDLQKYFNDNNNIIASNNKLIKSPSSKKSVNNNNYNLENSFLSDLEEDEDDFYLNNNTNNYNNNNNFNPQGNNNNEIKLPSNPIILNLIPQEETPKYNRYNTNDKNQDEDYNEIIKDFLYISGYKTASTLSDLQKLQITNIINCSGDLCENLSKDDELGIKYLTLNIRDNVSENIECLFFKCINYIDEVKEKKGKVLIHCYKGISRSVSILIAYLIYINKWTYDEAFDFVQLKRSIANPNIGFYLQLKTFYKRITLLSDRLEIFSCSHFSKAQYDFIVCRLIYNNISLKNDDNENENDDFEKKEIILDNRGMYIFANKKNIFIVEGKDISEKNYKLYKEQCLKYIKDIKKYEKLGDNCNNIDNDIIIYKKEEFEKKYNELITYKEVDIKFGDNNFSDKLYLD